MSPFDTVRARASALFMVALLVLAAGCSGVATPDPSPTTEEPTGDVTPTDSPTDSPTATSTPSPTASPTPTATPTPTPTSTPTPTESHSHDHADGAAGETKTGQMTVVVAGSRLDTAGVGSTDAGFWFREDTENYYKIWFAPRGESVTLAEALSTLGVEASADAVTYDGTTYRASDDGVSLTYRVDGREVDPETYELQHGDEVWVTVETPTMDVEVPGRHIDHEDSHIHGSIDMTVDGETVDFSEDRFQSASHSRYFHFEGGHADPWHAHSWAVTLEYAMATVGITVEDGRVVYDGETYDASEGGTTVRVLVNGEPVDPGSYFLKDGDHVRIVAENESSS